MNHAADKPLIFPIVKASLTLIGIVTATTLVIYSLLAGVFKFESQAQLSLYGAAVSLIIGLSGFVPVWLMSRKSAHGSAYGFMVSILVRIVVGFSAVAWLRWGAGIDNAQHLLMWVAGWYMLVLAVEVKLISTHVLAAASPTRMTAETP